MKRKVRWDEYIETPIFNFRFRVVGVALYRRISTNILRLIVDERGAYLKGTMLEEPDTLGGWDKNLRRKK